MKRLVALVALICLMIPTLVIASETGGADWDNDLGWGNGIRDCLAGHNHSYEQEGRDNPWGAGIDIVVLKTDWALLEEVTIEGKYDFENEEASVFAVVRVDLFGFLTGK